MWRTIVRSIGWAFAGIFIGAVVGSAAGAIVYPWFPSHFNNTIYSPEWGFGDAYSAKVHIQTGIAGAEVGAMLFCFLGFIVPWGHWIRER